jgi:hypothetical protein
VEKVIKLFASDVSGDEANDLVERFFSGDNPFRTRPILRHPSGRYVVVHEALLFPSVRERIEDELKDAKLADRYFKRRASVTESAGLRHLQVIFPSASITQSFEYFVPNPDNPLETAPAAYTKLVEGDGLVVVDDVAIIVEAKAGALSARARSGSLGRLRGDLRSLISDAAQQASRVRDRILADGFLRLRDGSLLDLSHVREVYTVALTLEDLSGIATVTDELVDAGLLPKDFLPLVVSLHDLRIISEIVDNPAEFLLYLRRRTLPELTRRFLAVDELDFFLHMFNTGLYVEPDPDVLAKELPLLPVTNAQRRRFKNQHPEFLTSRTVPLDDWYRYLGGERSTPAPKPAMKHMSDRLRQMVDSITALGLPGWLSATTTLLAGDAEMRTKVADYGPSLAQVTRGDGKPHTMTVIAGDRSQSLIVLAWISEPAGLDANQRAIFDTHHAAYLAAKKHQVQATRAVLIVYSSEGEYLRHIFDGRIAGPDPALDAEINRFGLRTPSEMNADQATKRFRQLKAGRRPR